MLHVPSRTIQTRLACRNNNSYSYLSHIFSRQSYRTPNKKTFRVEDVFTAFYSTIFAAATLADFKAKERRLHEWDKLIAEAREQLHDKNDKSSGRMKSIKSSRPTDSLQVVLTNPINNDSDPDFDRPLWHLREVMKQTPTHQQHLKLNGESHKNRSKSVQVDRTVEDFKSETFIHEEPDLDAPERDISDTAELNLLRSNISSLVERLLEISNFYRTASTDEEIAVDAQIQSQLQDIRQRLNSLEVSLDRLPMYTYEGFEIAQQQARELNAILWSICRRSKSDEASVNLMIAKISYNLLISAVPPNIETYNILLHEFALLERYDLAEQVLQSFWSSRLRPNKRTIELILLHYRTTKDKNGLNYIVKLMRGADGNLMQSSVYAKKYRIEHITIEGSQEKLQNFDPFNSRIRIGMMRHKLFFRSGYFYKKSPRDKHIFDALITAHFEVKGLRSAIRYISAASRERSKIKSSTLCMVIDSCIQRADFTSGLKLLMIILSQWTLSGYHTRFKLSPAVRYHINRLLFFCGINPNKGVNGHLPSRIKQYTESMIVQDIEYPKEALRKLIYHMRFECIKERLGRISELIENMCNILITEKVSNSIKCVDVDVTDKALELIDATTMMEIDIRETYGSSSDPDIGFELRMRGLEANIATSFSKMQEITTGLTMIRLRICASKLNNIKETISHKEAPSIDFSHLENLRLNLKILHMQLRVEIHLNIWWIRRLGLISCLSRSSTQWKRLNFLVQILTNIELKTDNLWDKHILRKRGFGLG